MLMVDIPVNERQRKERDNGSGVQGTIEHNQTRLEFDCIARFARVSRETDLQKRQAHHQKVMPLEVITRS